GGAALPERGGGRDDGARARVAREARGGAGTLARDGAEPPAGGRTGRGARGAWARRGVRRQRARRGGPALAALPGRPRFARRALGSAGAVFAVSLHVDVGGGDRDPRPRGEQGR